APVRIRHRQRVVSGSPQSHVERVRPAVRCHERVVTRQRRPAVAAAPVDGAPVVGYQVVADVQGGDGAAEGFPNLSPVRNTSAELRRLQGSNSYGQGTVTTLVATVPNDQRLRPGRLEYCLTGIDAVVAGKIKPAGEVRLWITAGKAHGARIAAVRLIRCIQR